MEVESGTCIYEFSALSSWADYFGDIREHRDEVRDALFKMLAASRRREIVRTDGRVVCAHVRLGDFRRLRADENFASVGGVRTPSEYFISLIENIRQAHGHLLPVQILTDGKGSTFSYWAGFLGDLAMIHHPDHVHAPIRPARINQKFYEGPLVGPVAEWPPLFLKNLRDIEVSVTLPD
jgi:hypothetical protein